MNLQLEAPPHGTSFPSRATIEGNGGCRDVEVPAFEPRALEILQMLNDLFDDLSHPAAHCQSE